MRKLTFLFATILTTTAAPAWAAVGPAPVALDPTSDPDPDPAPDAVQASDPLEHRDTVASGLERIERREEQRREERREERRAAAAVPPHLQAIAQCESGGDPSAVGGGGQFRGKYQFTYSTWAAVGGQGDPARAPEAEQDRRAAVLYEQSGPGQWPVCSQ